MRDYATRAADIVRALTLLEKEGSTMHSTEQDNAHALTFAFAPLRFDDGSGSDHWVSGRYKITCYEAYETEDVISKAKYAAYYKPDGWTNWGMCVDRKTTFYATLEQAQAACDAHRTIGEYRALGY